MGKLLKIFVLSVWLVWPGAWGSDAMAAAPAFQAAGAMSAGTGARTVAWPAHAVDDVALLIVQTANQPVTLSTPAGFVQVLNSPQGTGTAGSTVATRLAVFWARATSTTMASPTVADSGNNQVAQIITFRGVIGTGNPWDVTAGDVLNPASASFTIPGATTTIPDALVVAIAANGTDTNSAQTSGWVNASLTGLAEVTDVNATSGNGGGFGVATGVKAAAGAYGSTTGTLATSSVQGRMSIALKPQPPMVVSINRADPDPATASSVSWTITFNTGVTGVSGSNFTLVNAGLGGAPSITSVTGSGATWTVTASTGTGSGTLGLNMSNVAGVSPAVTTSMPFTGQVYSVRPLTPAVYYHDTTTGVNIGIDGPTNVVSGTNVTIPPIITASLSLTNTCTGNARSQNHPAGLYTHSRWYLTTDYAVATDIGANPGGSAFLRGQAATDTVIVSLYDYDPVSGAKTLIGSSPAITLAVPGTTTAYPYTISSPLYTVPAGHRLMLEYNFNQPATADRARVYCSATSAYIAVTETPATVMNCFTDNFNRANGAPAGNWVVANEGGSFGNPAIVSNRLRLTDATNSVSTMAALQQLFPAAGNKIIVEFDHFAYNGSGADGIGVVLSDASVAPVPGAFGGSLGYAPKQVSLGGDTTHPGFTGGWVGLAIDEYGNFSANTEGRSGGAAPGRTLDSAAVRGSGSGYTGYPYHRGTATLAPGVDVAGATPAPGYRYRIIIDHTDGVHAYTSVERDTTGAGTSYVFLIAPYDAKAEPGQASVPIYWFLSLTGSTGAVTNIHEVDNLRICSTQPQTLPTLHHIRILHDGSASTCAPESITVKACADAACSALYLGAVTFDLTNIAGATWSSDPVTFSGGQTTVTLTKGTAGAVTLGGTATSPAAGNATQCFNGATATCNLTFSVCAFDVIEAGAAAGTPIYTKLANTSFNLDVLSLSGSAQTANTVELVNAGSGTCSTYTSLQASSTAVPSSFTANQRKTFSFTYANAAPNVRVRVTDAVVPPQVSCSTDNFAIRPQSFAVTANLGGATLPAGNSFTMAAAAAVGAGYTGTPVLDTALVQDHNGAAAGVLNGSFNAATGNSATGAFQYHDVGAISLLADAVKDSGFTSVDQPNDCVAGNTSNTAAGGKYGCVIGSSAAGAFGRFYPHHFTYAATLAPACVGGGFTYMDQSALGINLTLSAKSANETATIRYTAGYPTLGIFSITGDNGGAAVAVSRLSPALPGFIWSNGAYSVTGNRAFTRNATPDGPYDSFALKAAVTDPDGATITGSAISNNTKIRFGRLKFSNTYGSELANLSIPLEAQYWNGTQGWVQNNLDSCTSIVQNNIKLSNASVTLASVTPVAGNSGKWSVLLNKPSASANVDVCVDAGADAVHAWCAATTPLAVPYLQTGGAYNEDPVAHATFGVYKGNSDFIYLRESY